MLPDVGSDNRITAGEPVQFRDHVLRLDMFVRFGQPEWLLGLPRAQLGPPAVSLANAVRHLPTIEMPNLHAQSVQCFPGIGYQAPVRRAILATFAGSIST